MKVALVYDRVNKWGGAEKVLLAMHDIWPEAPLYTSVYDKEKAPWAKVFEVRTTFLQKSLLPKTKHEYYPFLMGLAFETINFDQFDLVISVTSEFAKAIITKPNTFHLCYCLTPTSYLWSGYQQYFSDKSNAFKQVTKPMVDYLRFYDQIVCARPDAYIAISEAVKQRIKNYYHQDSNIVYPPVDLAKLPPTRNQQLATDYFLIVSRLVPNKRLDLAVQAFNKLGLPLKIVGQGRQKSDLQRSAKNNIEFLGSLTDAQLATYYKDCRALIVPAEEDFGIVAVEAQSYGKPVIAFDAGGAQETVINGKTGILFPSQTVVSLTEALGMLERIKVQPQHCIENAKKFSRGRFLADFKARVELEYTNYRKNV